MNSQPQTPTNHTMPTKLVPWELFGTRYILYDDLPADQQAFIHWNQGSTHMFDDAPYYYDYERWWERAFGSVRGAF